MFIELTGVGKCYTIDKTTFCDALTDVTLSIDEGEITAIVGRSGAGKSTLLHILGAMEPPTVGTYLLNGTDVTQCRDSELSALRNRYMGFVLQEFALINDLSVADNVLLPAYFNDRPLRTARAAVTPLLEQVGIAHLKHKKARHLSGGERQRVAIARALLNDPALILADEPTGNLDSETAADIFSLFQSLRDRGKTIIMVTHDNDLAARCDRIIRISDGRVI